MTANLQFAADCIYKRRWLQQPPSVASKSSRPASEVNPLSNGTAPGSGNRNTLTAEDDAKLVFGTVFSLRNMARKLGGDDDKYGKPSVIFALFQWVSC